MALKASFLALVAFLAVSHEAVSNLTKNRQKETTNESILTKTLFSNETKKLPHAIIIGAKKCGKSSKRNLIILGINKTDVYHIFAGTRALLKFIGAHHNISTAGAEVHFFDRNYHLGLDWYRYFSEFVLY
jgi:hypothetical protein